MGEAAAAMRDRLFTIRMSDEETARLDRIARNYGLNQAGVIRMLIKREDDALGGPPQAESSKFTKASKARKRK